jgi:Rhs element Vgr protein
MSVVTSTILSAGKQIDPAYAIVSIDIIKEANRIPRAQLVLIDGDAAQQTFAISDTDSFKPGQPIEIKLRYESAPNQEVSIFKGLVVGQRIEASLRGTLLTVELKDAAMKLTFDRKSAVHLKQSDDKIIGQILKQASLTRGTIAATKAVHKELVQYSCTDWDFMLARAEANGLLVTVDNEVVSVSEPTIMGAAKHTFTYGLDELFDFEIEADALHQYGDVESIAWDGKNQKPTSATRAAQFKLAQGNLNARKIAGELGARTTALKSLVPLDPKELQSWADGTLMRSRLSMLRGRIGIPGSGKIQLMDVIELASIGERFNGKTLVTGIRHRIDQDGWRTDIQFGLAAERFIERPDITDIPAAGLLPAIHGLQIGIVDQFTEDPNKELRVRVIVPAIDAQKGAIWARLAMPDAGKERGTFFYPEPGDEVVLGFLNDDPRQAVILGALYGTKNTPPPDVTPLTDKNEKKAIVSRAGSIIGFVDSDKASVFIQTPAKNKLLLDDGDEGVFISDQHGNTITMNKGGITIKSAKDLKIEASGNVEIKGKKVDLK